MDTVTWIVKHWHTWIVKHLGQIKRSKMELIMGMGIVMMKSLNTSVMTRLRRWML